MDREKVIKGVQNLRDAIAFDYIRETDHAVETLDNALDLLKEQEDLGTELTNAVELIHKKNERIEKLLKEQEAVKPEKEFSGSGVTWWNVCGNCKTAINPNDKYCHECGRSVKWE